MTEMELLDIEIGGQKVKDLSGITFLQWVSAKINGLKTFDPTIQELIRAVSNPLLGKMSDEMKIDLMRKVEKLNLPIP